MPSLAFSFFCLELRSLEIQSSSRSRQWTAPAPVQSNQAPEAVSGSLLLLFQTQCQLLCPVLQQITSKLQCQFLPLRAPANLDKTPVDAPLLLLSATASLENSCGRCCFLLQLHLKFLSLLPLSLQLHLKFLPAAALAPASSQVPASENHQKKGDFVHYRRDYILCSLQKGLHNFLYCYKHCSN